jgi:hypothetical protein
MKLTPIALQNIRKGALFNGILNAIINGAIAWSAGQGMNSINLTVDAISTQEHTALSSAITTAVSLALILSIIGYFTIKLEHKPPFFPKALVLTLKNSLYTLGILVTLAIFIQRYFGSIPVNPGIAALITALVAGVTAGWVTYITHVELVRSAQGE